ncbi:MAG: 5-oxoprolinase subunit PxpB [Solirubrobacteraceae bacterium]|nr:5-oxoprolinase subunit PxpB [Solirubrobacteraceae bacterium]
MTETPRVLALGDTAVSLELGSVLDAATSDRVRALDEAMRARPFPGFREAVPTYRSLLVVYDRERTRFDEVRDALLEAARAPLPVPAPGRCIDVPVVYGGADGPDIEGVAHRHGLDVAGVVARHSATEYTALMLGFTPGFAYLGLLPESLETPRLETPRVRVPAGSVGIAGRQTGIYPAASPGGWNLIGRTSLRLFDPEAERPCLVTAGDRVRFRPVDRLPEATPYVAPAPVPAHPAIEVLEPGLLTTVQDAGRSGYRRLGVSPSGALDRPALALANRAAGNPDGAAGLELTLAGPTLRFLRPVRFALAGADLGAVLQRPDLGDWPVPSGIAVLARAGNLLSFRGRRRGCRAYLACAGGVEVPLVLGSRATDRGAGFGGFGGRALRGGDVLGIASAAGSAAVLFAEAPERGAASPVVVRVVPGPQRADFPEASIESFASQVWRVGSLSDRVGCRLEGSPLAHRGPGEIVSDGMVPGSIQVPPDGRPIVMLADAPTTGGYPKIGAVVSDDLPLVAQLVPGEGEVRFELLEGPGAR